MQSGDYVARIIKADEFEAKTLNRKNIKPGIDAVNGKIKGKETEITSHYIFNHKIFKLKQVERWLSNNLISYISLKKQDMEEQKPLLLYSPIYSYTAEAFVEKLLEVDAEQDLEIWINSPGGSVFAGWSIIGPLMERVGKNIAKVYGDASSMIFYALLFMDRVEALDVTSFTIHRADGYAETEEDKQLLVDINAKLRAKMEKRINAKVFKEVTGKSFKDIFDSDTRINVNIDAKQAKQIGLVDKVIRLEPKKLQAMNERFVAFVDFDEQGSPEITSRGSDIESEQITDNNVELKTPKKMTKDELKAQHPDVYNAIYGEGRQAGIEAEQDRTSAFLAFNDIDPTAVSEAIKEGKPISQTFMAEMTRKSFSAENLQKAKDDSPEALKKAADEEAAKEKTEEEKKVEAEAKKFEEEVRESAGLPNKKED